MEAVSQYVTYIPVQNWSKSMLVWYHFFLDTIRDYTFPDTNKIWVQ